MKWVYPRSRSRPCPRHDKKIIEEDGNWFCPIFILSYYFEDTSSVFMILPFNCHHHKYPHKQPHESQSTPAPPTPSLFQFHNIHQLLKHFPIEPPSHRYHRNGTKSISQRRIGKIIWNLWSNPINLRVLIEIAIIFHWLSGVWVCQCVQWPIKGDGLEGN